MATLTAMNYNGQVYNPHTAQGLYDWNTQPQAPFVDMLRRLSSPVESALEMDFQKKRIVGLMYTSWLDHFMLSVYRNFPAELNDKAEDIWKSWEDFQTTRNKEVSKALSHHRTSSLLSTLDSNTYTALSVLKKLDKLAKKEKRPAARYWLKLCRIRLDTDFTLYENVLDQMILVDRPLKKMLDKEPEYYADSQKKAEKNNWFTRLTRQSTLSSLIQQMMRVSPDQESSPTSNTSANKKAKDKEQEEVYSRKVTP